MVAPDATVLSSGERDLLEEWLDCVATNCS
jgi:hypothetical protein